jgi:uncharacterized membrane protein YhdT
VPVTFAICLLLLLGTSIGADGKDLNTTFPTLGSRIFLAMGHLLFVPGFFRNESETNQAGVARRRLIAVARGAVLCVPVMLIVGILLASADPIFRSWFDLTAVLQHVVLIVIGAWVVVGLFRVSSAKEPSAPLPAPPSLGIVEAACVLGGLCTLYATFVIAQFVALSGGGRHVLVTHGLTYAQYARSGFFQLLACAAITLIVLLSVRACANPAHPVLIALAGMTVALTICIVIVAIRRLQLYEAVFGLTMLRLACLVVAVWIGIVFVLLGTTIHHRGLPRQWFPAAVMLSGLIFIGLWSISNPASIVAQTNLHRAEHGQRFDINQAASLGPDAVPTLVTGLPLLNDSQAIQLRHAICARPQGKDAGTAFNMSKARANEDVTRECSSSR